MRVCTLIQLACIFSFFLVIVGGGCRGFGYRRYLVHDRYILYTEAVYTIKTPFLFSLAFKASSAAISYDGGSMVVNLSVPFARDFTYSRLFLSSSFVVAWFFVSFTSQQVQ